MRITWTNVGVYLLNKLAALGSLLMFMCLYLLLASEFDLYDFTEYLSDLTLWGLIGGYALIMTILIDFVSYKWIRVTFQTSILLHALAGFIVFLPVYGMNIFSVIAGSIGALCACIYAFSYAIIRKRRIGWVLLLMFPLLLSIRLIDFTIKEGWTEERTNSSFSAEFERFHGRNEIPISLKKGEEITSYLSIEQRNEGGHGFRVLDPKGKAVGMEMIEEQADTYEEYTNIQSDVFQFQAESEGTYRLIVRGHDLEGKIEVNWEID